MSEGDSPRWRGTHADQRAKERKQRLLSTGYDIVGDKGAAALTVRAVCAGANVGLRYFYESYPDVDSLLGAVYDTAVARLLAAVYEQHITAAPSALRSRIRQALDSAVGYLSEDAACGRILFIEALSNEALRNKAAETLPTFIAAVRQAVNDAAPAELDAERGRLETSVLAGALTMAVSDWLADPTGIARGTLVDYCTDVAVAILTLPGQNQPH